MTDRYEGNAKALTTGFGRRVNDDQNSITAGPRGPVLMQDVHLLISRAHRSVSS